MASGYKWKYLNKTENEEAFSSIRAEVGSEIIAQMLLNRGISSVDNAKAFLNPAAAKLSSPFVFPDMEKVVQGINSAIEKQEHIVVFGDFDADGVTSTAVLYKTLKFLNASVSYYIPERTEEGHGLNRGAVCKLISSRKAKIIITVDCGISNLSEVKLAESLGTKVIITDHHEALDELPEAYAIINPKILDGHEDIKYLAGVGVAYKVAHALLQFANKEEFIEEILHLVAIGTVGDVVPLLGENRTIVYQGLELLSRKKPASISKLLEIAGSRPDQPISSSTVAFTIVPRINAMGRLNEAHPAVEFLTTEDEGLIGSLANELEVNNKERQQIGEVTVKQAEEKIQNMPEFEVNKAIILSDTDWHPGIVGIVASRLVEKYYRPVLLIALDMEKNEARCSARSVEGLNLFEALNEVSDMFTKFGGHALAAGFTIDLNKISLQEAVERLHAVINKNAGSEEFKPELYIDLDIEAEDLTEGFVEELNRLAPYGEANPYPMFSISNLTLKQFNRMGAKKNHLKVLLADKNSKILEAVWWQRDSIDAEVDEPLKVAFTPSINTFRDQKKVQLVLKDVQTLTKTKTDKQELVCKKSMPVLVVEEKTEIKQDFSETQESSKFGIKFIDHRKETGLKKEFLKHLYSKKNSLLVFAESQRSLELVDKVPFLKEVAAKRHGVKQSESLVLFDIPPDKATFINLLEKTQAKEVHLIGLKNDIEPLEILKTISGMLKYAYKSKNGIINLEQAAAFLAISNEAALACIELFDTAGVIEVNELGEDFIKFCFLGSKNSDEVVHMPEYDVFLETLKDSSDFRSSLLGLEQLNDLEQVLLNESRFFV